jgi:hypothetical protein
MKQPRKSLNSTKVLRVVQVYNLLILGLQTFAFGVKNDLRSSSTIRSEMSENVSNNRYEFNTNNNFNDNTGGLYPSLSTLLKDEPRHDNHEHFNFKFELEKQENKDTSPWKDVTSDFNFDK